MRQKPRIAPIGFVAECTSIEIDRDGTERVLESYTDRDGKREYHRKAPSPVAPDSPDADAS